MSPASLHPSAWTLSMDVSDSSTQKFRQQLFAELWWSLICGGFTWTQLVPFCGFSVFEFFLLDKPPFSHHPWRHDSSFISVFSACAQRTLTYHCPSAYFLMDVRWPSGHTPQVSSVIGCIDLWPLVKSFWEQSVYLMMIILTSYDLFLIKSIKVTWTNI